MNQAPKTPTDTFLELEKEFIAGELFIKDIELSFSSAEDISVSGSGELTYDNVEDVLTIKVSIFESDIEPLKLILHDEGQYSPFFKLKGKTPDGLSIISTQATIGGVSLGIGYTIALKLRSVSIEKNIPNNTSPKEIYGLLNTIAFRPTDNVLRNRERKQNKNDRYSDYLQLAFQPFEMCLRAGGGKNEFKLLIFNFDDQGERSRQLSEYAVLNALSFLFYKKITWRTKITNDSDKITLSLFTKVPEGWAGMLNSIDRFDTSGSHFEVLEKYILYFLKSTDNDRENLVFLLDYFWHVTSTRNPLIIVPIACYTLEGIIKYFFGDELPVTNEEQYFNTVRASLFERVNTTTMNEVTSPDDFDSTEINMTTLFAENVGRLAGRVSSTEYKSFAKYLQWIRVKHHHLISDELIKIWKDYRHKLLHGEFKALQQENIFNPNGLLRKWAILQSSIYNVVLWKIGYKGFIKDFTSPKWPLKLFES